MIDASIRQLLDEINNTKTEYPAQTSLAEWISDQCRQTPSNVAVKTYDAELTFAELEIQSNQLARWLSDNGTRPGDLVGLCTERTTSTVVAMVAILKAGAGYVPLDPDYPADRLQYMCDDASIESVIAHNSTMPLAQSLARNIWSLDELQSKYSQLDPSPNIVPVDVNTSPAYVIYTSGSTGKPKGVVVPHRAAVNFLNSMKKTPGIGPNDVMIAMTTLSFDISVLEVFLPLVSGATIAMVDRSTARDGMLLAKAFEDFEATILQATPTTWRFVLESGWNGNKGLKLITGGEPLPRDLIQPLLRRCGELWNLYGPTETTVWSTQQKVENAENRILVGTPIDNTQVFIVNDSDQQVAIEEEGELLIGGEGVTLGYLNRPELTAEKFFDFVDDQGEKHKVYRTGDLAKFTSDGRIDCLGRIDGQIKLHGHRIELDEIAAVLTKFTGVRRAATNVREDIPGDKKLVGYLIVEPADHSLDISVLRDFCEQHLPEYMIPNQFMLVEEFPQTPSGKLDRKALPKPTSARPEIATPMVPARNEWESALAAIWCEVLQLDDVGVHDNFFELGGKSILALRVIRLVKDKYNKQITSPEFFDRPTIEDLAILLAQEAPQAEHLEPAADYSREDIAIIGMACRFPDARNVSEYWQNLIQNRETIRFFSKEELDSTLSPETIDSPQYVAARGIVDDADLFDEHFFGVTPNEAKLIDPQQRISLEVAYHALEDAGIHPESSQAKIGVWAGSYTTTYYQKNLLANPELVDTVGEFQLSVYNEKDYIATRIAHKLNLRGPAINVNTACSTGLVSVIEACKSIHAGDCDMALAGGASIHFPQNSGHLHQAGSIMSPDGHCRPFDADSAGTLFSDGVGMVVLKRLSAAIKDNDRIYAVIKGCGINNDGGHKASFTAPSVEGQSGAIRQAIQNAGVEVNDIGYVEAHGTATPIGDPIEVSALTKTFANYTDEKQFCAIGSVKSNLGHTVAAAGIAGLIKSSLALQQEIIPATLHYQTPNPQIDFEQSPFFVADKNHKWERTNAPRHAGISSFGVGGTNAHVIISEAPQIEVQSNQEQAQPTNGYPVSLLPMTAKRQESIDSLESDLLEKLSSSQANLGGLAYTLQRQRYHFGVRKFVIADSQQECVDLLQQTKPHRSGQAKLASPRQKLTFMFPGQGSQYVGMGKNLYDHSKVFRSAVDECAEILNRYLDRDLRDVLYPEGSEDQAAEILRSTQFTQPAIFTIGYSLAKLWQHWGYEPDSFIGHSIGEFVAGCLAGVFQLEDALMLIAKRGEWMQNLPGGSMLSVKSSGEDIEKRLTGSLAIASYNAPTLCVVAGPTTEVEAFQQLLENDGIVCRHLHTSHAFHSSMMDEIVAPYEKLIQSIELHPPQKPILSAVTGDWMSDEVATDPRYWAEHLRAPVKFSTAIEKIWQTQPDQVLLELGPRKTLSTLALQHAKPAARSQNDHSKTTKHLAFSSLGDSAENNSEWYSILWSVGQLWLQGISPQWDRFYEDGLPEKTDAPLYPFVRKRHFVEPLGSQPTRSNPSASDTHPTNEPTTSTETSISGKVIMDKKLIQCRKSQIAEKIAEVFENTSGVEVNEFDSSMTFLEMGLDSLVLTQTASAMKKAFQAEVTFRQMLEETPTVEALTDFLDGLLPASQFEDRFEEVVAQETDSNPDPINLPSPASQSANSPAVPQSSASVPQSSASVQPSAISASPMTAPPMMAPGIHPSVGTDSPTHAIIQNQLNLMQAQLQLLSGTSPIQPASAQQFPVQQTVQVATPTTPSAIEDSSSSTVPTPEHQTAKTPSNCQVTRPQQDAKPEEKKKVFGAGARVNLNSDQLSTRQQDYLDSFIQSWNQQTPSSKSTAQQHRKYFADPRTVSGFRPNLKEMTYPIVTDKSQGVHLWDIDDNRYIDVTCGFGSNFLGHSPDFMVEAMSEQLHQGYEIGPQHPLAGEVAKLFCEITCNERMAFANTGSEAVLGAVRLARTATGNEKVVMFTGDYHGILDEVIVRGGKNHKSFPAATGIPKSAVDNVVVLEYGTEESYKYIEENLDEIACVLVETVQSRRPEFQPKEFLQKLGKLMENAEAALIFDEVITGLRIAPGGAQQHFGVKADLATYGKVVGGGMPIGVIAGKAKYMDGLDGGFWSFGDESKPEAGMTYFAGTFVRHPVALAAAHRILQHIQQVGQAAYDRLNQLTDNLASRINELCERSEAPIYFANFGSLFKIQFKEELLYSELLFAALRKRGIHIWDHRPCLLTLAHTEEHVDEIVQAFGESLRELQEVGFIPGNHETLTEFEFSSLRKSKTPPVPNAQVGQDREGNPGWFIADSQQPGKYIQVGLLEN